MEGEAAGGGIDFGGVADAGKKEDVGAIEEAEGEAVVAGGGVVEDEGGDGAGGEGAGGDPGEGAVVPDDGDFGTADFGVVAGEEGEEEGDGEEGEAEFRAEEADDGEEASGEPVMAEVEEVAVAIEDFNFVFGDHDLRMIVHGWARMVVEYERTVVIDSAARGVAQSK